MLTSASCYFNNQMLFDNVKVKLFLLNVDGKQIAELRAKEIITHPIYSPKQEGELH